MLDKAVLCCVQNMKDDCEMLSAEKDHLQEIGEELIGLIGEPDKPEVERSIDDVDAALKALNDACEARQKSLAGALQQAKCFHQELTVSICLSAGVVCCCCCCCLQWLMMMMMMIYVWFFTGCTL